MANTITRTITVYTYTTASFDPGTMKVKTHSVEQTPIKRGKRDLDAWQKALSEKGLFLLPVIETEVTVAMNLVDFYAYGTVIDPNDKEQKVETIPEKLRRWEEDAKRALEAQKDNKESNDE